MAFPLKPLRQVAPEIVTPAQAEGVAHCVFVGRYAAELQACLSHCVLGIEALALQIGGACFEMKTDLFVHLFFEASTAERRAKPRLETGPEPAHDPASASFSVQVDGVSCRMLPIMPAMRFHFSVSAVSCLRPAGVRP